MKHEILNIEGCGKCIKLSNGVIEITATLDFGPRIIGYNLIGEKNIFNIVGKSDPLVSEYGECYTFGGHRLWHAPEIKPRCYVPDNDPIKYDITETGAIFYGNREEPTGIEKRIELIMEENSSSVEVKHTLINNSVWEIECAPWAITIVAPGGRLIIPQEPFVINTVDPLPARPMVLWSYTNTADSRYKFGEKFVIVKNDTNCKMPQKIGLLNKVGWAAYQLDDLVFMKTFDFIEDAVYPDYMCNLETFTKEDFHEFETIAPLSIMDPGTSVDYSEKWSLFNGVTVDDDENEMEKVFAELRKQVK